MSHQLTDRVALVTGGGTGFGRATSERLARAGASVAIAYGRSANDAEQTKEAIEAQGGQAATFQADLLDTRTCGQLVDAVVEHFGRLDILVHNAATTVRVPFTDLEGLTEEGWDRVMALNVKVPWLLTRVAAPHLQALGVGAVVAVASVAAYEPAGSLVYSVSKAALVNLCQVLARVLAPEIRVNAVAPGFMHTRWTAHYSDEAVRSYEDKALLGRTIPMEDAADVVVMLAGNDSITGQTVIVDSGVAVGR
jgi:3-oxoacyl-[acyl-carrier protein] reductase